MLNLTHSYSRKLLAHTHTHAHTHAHTRTHTHTHAHTRRYDMLKLFETGKSHMAVLMRPPADEAQSKKGKQGGGTSHTHTHVRAHTHTCACTHTHTHTCTHACTHTRMHAHTHMRVHTCTRMCAGLPSFVFSPHRSLL
jgi:hypothetical protein